MITDNLIAYCKRSLSIGTAGIFMSIFAGRELISHEHFLEFVKPPGAVQAIVETARNSSID